MNEIRLKIMRLAELVRKKTALEFKFAVYSSTVSPSYNATKANQCGEEIVSIDTEINEIYKHFEIQTP